MQSHGFARKPSGWPSESEKGLATLNYLEGKEPP